ncbi:D-altritol 5-dehydrogenase-like [Chelonus insularis]|uniref:D-altritol 5-dehydrogenase-like n=1 Tax=Chelonus insularis TaxID=460826 RepID=UPI00158E917B|nr:D-altritol 5-dehydrogenase-like [Chelonus insularis]
MPMRQKIAKNLGLEYEVCTPDQLEGKKFDFVIDCSGSASAIESAFPLLNNRGTLCIFGVANPTATMKINPFEVYMKELKIFGVKVNPFTFPNGLSLVQTMGNQYLNHEKLGIHVCKLSEYEDAIHALREKQVTKVIFELC